MFFRRFRFLLFFGILWRSYHKSGGKHWQKCSTEEYPSSAAISVMEEVVSNSRTEAADNRAWVRFSTKVISYCFFKSRSVCREERPKRVARPSSVQV